jgi:transposase
MRLGPEKNGGQAAQALGRSPRGFSTKIHAGCLDEKTSAALELTGGARHDAPVVEAVFAQLPAMPQLTYAVMDKGYDSDQIRQYLQSREVLPIIPPKRHRKKPIIYDLEQYQLREHVERFFNKLKQFRRIATRYEKLRHTFLAFIHLAASWLMIK